MSIYPIELPIVPKLPKPRDTKEQRFDQFCHDFPEVYDEILKTCRDTLAADRSAILHMRWIVEDLRRVKHWSINNNYAPLYVDKVEAEFPEFRGHFHKRERAVKQMKKVPAYR